MKDYVLITGGSKGIGYAIAKKFAENKYNVVLLARHKDSLDKAAAEIKRLYGVEAEVLVKDLSVHNAAQEVADELDTKGMEISMLVNNAAFGDYGFFWKANIEDVLGMIQVNNASLVHLCHVFLPRMIAKKSGKILNIASDGGFMPVPLMAVYFATKAFDISFGMALANEVEGTGVTVTTVCPGQTNTKFGVRAYHNPKFVLSGLQPEEVAEAAYNALFAETQLTVVGFASKMVTFLTRFIPKKTIAKMARQRMEASEK